MESEHDAVPFFTRLRFQCAGSSIGACRRTHFRLPNRAVVEWELELLRIDWWANRRDVPALRIVRPTAPRPPWGSSQSRLQFLHPTGTIVRPNRSANVTLGLVDVFDPFASRVEQRIGSPQVIDRRKKRT